MAEEILLSEIYRPKKMSDVILPKSIKDIAVGIVDSGKIPNLLFCGVSGTGKTTLATILANELGYEWIYINASDEGRSLDTVRTTIKDFASTTALTGSKKVVILDEFCGCTSIVQDALKAFFEQYSSSCSFILTANNKTKINAPILSRFSQIDFLIPKEEAVDLRVAYLKRLIDICKKEGIEAEVPALGELIKKNFPDFRKVLNFLQLFKDTKVFNLDSIQSLDTPTQKIVEYLRAKNFKELRQLISQTPNIDIGSINRELYDLMTDIIKPSSQPNAIVIMAKYNDMVSRSQDDEILIMSEFIELMSDVEFV